MSGDDWQDLCILTLRTHHGDDLVRVPDNDRGDAGLEAFTVTGLAYQAYSPQGTLTTSQRYEKQRSKMTTDIGKLIDNPAKLQALLGPVKISRWILLVPVFDSRRAVEHASVQTERLRAAGLPYIETNSYVMIQTLEEDFAGALRTVQSQGLARLGIPDPVELDYSTVSSELVDRMRAKLAAVYPPGAPLDRFLSALLEWNVSGRSHRDHLRDFFSELDGRLDEEFEALRNRVQYELSLNQPDPKSLLALAMKMAEDVANLTNTGPLRSQDIAYGQVAEWLMQCPLELRSDLRARP